MRGGTIALSPSRCCEGGGASAAGPSEREALMLARRCLLRMRITQRRGGRQESRRSARAQAFTRDRAAGAAHLQQRRSARAGATPRWREYAAAGRSQEKALGAVVLLQVPVHCHTFSLRLIPSRNHNPREWACGRCVQQAASVSPCWRGPAALVAVRRRKWRE